MAISSNSPVAAETVPKSCARDGEESIRCRVGSDVRHLAVDGLCRLAVEAGQRELRHRLCAQPALAARELHGGKGLHVYLGTWHRWGRGPRGFERSLASVRGRARWKESKTLRGVDGASDEAADEHQGEDGEDLELLEIGPAEADGIFAALELVALEQRFEMLVGLGGREAPEQHPEEPQRQQPGEADAKDPLPDRKRPDHAAAAYLAQPPAPRHDRQQEAEADRERGDARDPPRHQQGRDASETENERSEDCHDECRVTASVRPASRPP